MGLKRELRLSRSRFQKNLGTNNIDSYLEILSDSLGLLRANSFEISEIERGLGLSTNRPAAVLVSEIVNVKNVPSGTSISYGYLATTTSETQLGLVAIGFSDGIPRDCSNTLQVEVAGHPVRNLGRIAMDQMVVELGALAVPLGSEVSIEFSEMANKSRFSELEIFARVTSRVKRVIVE